MKNPIVQVSPDFWNIRGSFKIAGVVDIGTQASLVRLTGGGFAFLDAYSLGSEVLQQVAELTDDGEEVRAILNLHPFHTVHVQRMHELYPHASLYGTARHLERFPELPWETLTCEDPVLHRLFADDLAFSVPRGVDFISANENIHFSSVLALHRASGTIHSDDTLMFIEFPRLMRMLGLRDRLSLHPTLAMALEKRPGAADEFRAWGEELLDEWSTAENLCAAHSAPLLARDNRGAPLAERLRSAMARAEKVLKAHSRRHG